MCSSAQDAHRMIGESCLLESKAVQAVAPVVEEQSKH